MIIPAAGLTLGPGDIYFIAFERFALPLIDPFNYGVLGAAGVAVSGASVIPNNRTISRE